MSAVRRLGEVSREYEALATDYAALAREAANAEAEHKRAKARHMVTARAEDPKLSAAWAETTADADEAVAALLSDRLLSAAVADAARAKLNQLREAVAVGRSVLVAERTADSIHASGTGGAS